MQRTINLRIHEIETRYYLWQPFGVCSDAYDCSRHKPHICTRGSDSQRRQHRGRPRGCRLYDIHTAHVAEGQGVQPIQPAGEGVYALRQHRILQGRDDAFQGIRHPLRHGRTHRPERCALCGADKPVGRRGGTPQAEDKQRRGRGRHQGRQHPVDRLL